MKWLKEVLEALSKIKHKGMTPLVCPRCGTNNIRPEKSVTLGLLPTVYVCNDCGYRGHVVAEMDNEDSKP